MQCNHGLVPRKAQAIPCVPCAKTCKDHDDVFPVQSRSVWLANTIPCTLKRSRMMYFHFDLSLGPWIDFGEPDNTTTQIRPVSQISQTRRRRAKRNHSELFLLPPNHSTIAFWYRTYSVVALVCTQLPIIGFWDHYNTKGSLTNSNLYNFFLQSVRICMVGTEGRLRIK